MFQILILIKNIIYYLRKQKVTIKMFFGVKTIARK